VSPVGPARPVTNAQDGSVAARLRDSAVRASSYGSLSAMPQAVDVVTVVDTLDLLADLAASAHRAGKFIAPDALVDVLALAMAAQPDGAAERQAQRRAQHEQLVADGLAQPEPRWLAAVHAQVDAIHLHAAAEQTMTLGQLVDVLEQQDPAALVRYAGAGLEGQAPSEIASWRGSYADLALDHEPDTEITCRALLGVLQRAVGREFTGYKGGDFTMSRETPVWVDNWGEYSGHRGICRVEVQDDAVLLHLQVTE